MAAARELFLKSGFDRVTAREIAAAAGTTPAMIHYYFDNKLGLFRAMLQEVIAPVGRMLGAAAGDSSAGSMDLAALMSMHIRTVAKHPWVATLIVNEVLAEGGKFRATFVREIAGQFVPLLVRLIEQGCQSGQLRRDLDPQLTALSILSLNLFPLISRPVSGAVLDFGLEGAQLDRLIEHTTRVLLEGIGGRGAQ